MHLTPERHAFIAAALTRGDTYAQIAVALNVSRPAISQLVNRHASLRRLKLRSGSSSLAQLRAYREELRLVEQEVVELNRRVRRAVRELEDEILIAEAHIP